MGLDMYLYRRRKAQEQELIGYWCKANQIHGWFERNVGAGLIENCKCYPVSEACLEHLVADCKLVLDKPELAKEVLPVTSGLFFGGDTYGEGYFEDVKQTILLIEDILVHLEGDCELFYRAWW